MSFILGCRSCDFLWEICSIRYLQFWQHFLLLLTFGGMFSRFPNILQIKMPLSFLLISKLFYQKLSQKYRKRHCVKSVQICSYFWSVFSCIRTEYGDSTYLDNFHAVMGFQFFYAVSCK